MARIPVNIPKRRTVDLLFLGYRGMGQFTDYIPIRRLSDNLAGCRVTRKRKNQIVKNLN